MFYEKFIKLCNERGIAPSKVALDLGFAKSTVTRWKSGRNGITDKNLHLVADYFGVPVSYFQDNKRAVQPDGSVPVNTSDGDFPSAIYPGQKKAEGELLRPASPSERDDIIGRIKRYLDTLPENSLIMVEDIVRVIADKK